MICPSVLSGSVQTSMTAIEAAVNSWLALRFGYDLRHRNEPVGDAKSTDATSTASVVLNF